MKKKSIIRERVVSLFFILIFIAVCMGIGAGMAYINHESDPTDVAAGYFRAFVSSDFNKMYDYLTKEKEVYINKETYIEAMKQMRLQYTIDSYEILDPEKKNGQKLVRVKCIDDSKKENRYFEIYVDEIRKGMNIIPEYSVNCDSMIVKNFTVVISSGNQLKINGKTITKDNASVEEKDGKLTYKFKGILLGDYKVVATNKYYAVNSQVDLKKPDTTLDMTKKSYTASEEYSGKIKQSGDKVIKLFYKAARDKNPSYPNLIKCFSNNKKLKSKVKNLVTKTQDIIYPPDTKNIENYKVSDFNINNLKSTITYNDKTKVYTLKYTYSYNYMASTKTTLYNSYVYTLSGKCKSEMTLSYTLKGDDISLTDIKLLNKNTKKE